MVPLLLVGLLKLLKPFGGSWRLLGCRFLGQRALGLGGVLGREVPGGGPCLGGSGPCVAGGPLARQPLGPGGGAPKIRESHQNQEIEQTACLENPKP